MNYLITQSLLSSWIYTKNCYEGCEDDALAELVDAVTRIPKPQTQDMINGIEFENEVYRAAAGAARKPHPLWEPGIQAVSSIIKGAATQVKLYRTVETADRQFLLYGILDALKASEIFDVKFSNASFNSADLAGKYLDSPQHPAYFKLEPDANKFTYLVSDGTDIYTETYLRKHTQPIQEIINQFIREIELLGLLPIYEEKWRAHG